MRSETKRTLHVAAHSKTMASSLHRLLTLSSNLRIRAACRAHSHDTRLRPDARSTLTVPQSYGIKITTDMVNKLDALYNIDPTVQSNHTLQEQLIDHAQELAIELIQEPINEAMSGTLWLFPTAVSAAFGWIHSILLSSRPVSSRLHFSTCLGTC
jgi:hypothetical protein